jgi:hypothetical protein
MHAFFPPSSFRSLSDPCLLPLFRRLLCRSFCYDIFLDRLVLKAENVTVEHMQLMVQTLSLHIRLQEKMANNNTDEPWQNV